jgi:hypothetical protein
VDARPLSGYAEANASPVFWDATTLGMPGQVKRYSPGWQDFKLARGDSTTVIWIISRFVERKEQRSPGPVTGTGPSEATVLPTALDATEDSGDGIAMLEIVAEAGNNETAFVQAASEIDWSRRPAADFARAVRLALAAGAHLLARNLATQGARLYPDHAELGKMARILAPPRVVRADLPPVPSLQANQDWLRAHSDGYRGQWVALRDGIFLAAAATARQLRAHLKSIDGVLITKVF